MLEALLCFKVSVTLPAALRWGVSAQHFSYKTPFKSLLIELLILQLRTLVYLIDCIELIPHRIHSCCIRGRGQPSEKGTPVCSSLQGHCEINLHEDLISGLPLEKLIRQSDLSS
jgi:hypothetical protein